MRILLLLGLLAFPSSPSATPRQAPPEPVPPLVTFRDAGDYCSWHLYYLPSTKPVPFHESLKCPEHAMWDTKDRRTIYFLDRRIYSVNWEEGAKAVLAGSLEEPVGKYEGVFVLTPKSGRLRLGQLVELDEKDIVTEEDGVHYVYEGKKYPAKGLPDDGLPAMAVVKEFTLGLWETVAAAPTRAFGENVPGIAPVMGHLKPKEGVISQQQILWAGTCPQEGCGDMPELGKKERQKLVDLVDLPDGEDEIEYLGYHPVDGERGLLFKVTKGDYPHISRPVFYCWDKCKKTQDLRETRYQLSVQHRGDFVLMAQEYDNSGARIFLFGEKIPKVTADTAFWLPFSLKLDPPRDPASESSAFVFPGIKGTTVTIKKRRRR